MDGAVYRNDLTLRTSKKTMTWRLHLLTLLMLMRAIRLRIENHGSFDESNETLSF